MKLPDLKLLEGLESKVSHLDPKFEARTKEDHEPIEMVFLDLPLISTASDRINFKPYNATVSLENVILTVQVPASEVLQTDPEVRYVLPDILSKDESGAYTLQKALPTYRITPKGLAYICHQIASAYEEIHEMWRTDKSIENLMRG
jgi:hypothetical protein